ncbi:TPA: N-acetyldiaminopimelate deacetylase [Streptococcus suis]|jgi:N-acetyldiaminopimelate deacetylase|uniref:N-acetyldiaminopimelate deacetylase n=1 Tax=Streptococcus suis TaxID=1307 RepID=A0A9X4MMB2_STRSU|nr:N-acetyldiaminopimelate deacetylase [Streptococcus parasuis]MCA9760105.1 N-acetyldiaminopimelate deacetylase [Streptococcus sp.]MDG3181530.1 N-acetyldiaminopimelate deacetylase [Streptococcus suis]MBV1944382.1 N-acetyldiaminopimelate deacetylase [Streptococcus parasuis]MDG3213476.1 N-acetyldiaminopimelate deacetylase [Streptococcus suis]MDG4511656.1 N-acetyldiaminopimelate deacetylase [Streptococcus suis]
MLDLIATRRALHQIPELGMEEFKTHAFLMETIEGLLQDCSFSQVRTWETGILVYLTGSAPQKTIGWRTDIDGLPIVEETGLDFKSLQPDRMHACGHDFHMTIALGLLEKMAEQQPKNNLLFLFQPAEENLAGGMLMYEAGAFGDWLPDEFYGLHVRPDLKVGQMATNRATLFAGTCEVKIRFTGKGGHAAFPHTANDALVAASYFVTQVQSVVSRNVDPIEGAVVTFGSMHAGTTNNVITETAFLHGTIRALTQSMSLLVQKRVREIAEGIALSFGVDLEIELNPSGYLPVENNPQLADELMTYFEQVDGVEMIDCPPAMTGEDFGYLLNKVPGVMFWLGVDTPYPLHNPRLSPKEEVLPFAVDKLSDFLKTKAN